MRQTMFIFILKMSKIKQYRTINHNKIINNYYTIESFTTLSFFFFNAAFLTFLSLQQSQPPLRHL